jgi:nicotinamidase-related amidase
MNAKILLLIIDMQNDFCSPKGSLYVPGSEKDAIRLAKFISKNEGVIDHIILTQDSHNVIDISHPVFWEDKHGNPPDPFTQISLKQVIGGLWKPRFQKGKAIEYIRKLGQQGEFPHTIWPEHCIIGSNGAAIIDEIIEPVKSWARRGNFYDVVVKGTNPLTEHFGALKAIVPVPGSPETQLNSAMVDKLIHAGRIYIAGEAKSHCVATTIGQILHLSGLARKLRIISDCMSDVTGFEEIALPIYEKAKTDGAEFVLSTEAVSLNALTPT